MILRRGGIAFIAPNHIRRSVALRPNSSILQNVSDNIGKDQRCRQHGQHERPVKEPPPFRAIAILQRVNHESVHYNHHECGDTEGNCVAQASRCGRDTAADKRNHKGRPASRTNKSGNRDEKREYGDAQGAGAGFLFSFCHRGLVSRFHLNRVEQRRICFFHRRSEFINRFKNLGFLCLRIYKPITTLLGVN